MNVAEDLYDYLKNNDRAEVVGFGTFYVKTSPAKINELTGTIEPPKREILFTKELTEDMSFVDFMASHEFISRQTAYTWIKQYADSLLEKIKIGRVVTLGKLGTIEKGLLEDIKFTPSNDLNLLGSSFALGTLRNVQTFDNDQKEIEVIPSGKENTTLSNENTISQEGSNTQKTIEDQINNAEKLSEKDKVQESDTQTQERIIQHSEAEVDTMVEKPQDITEEEVKSNISDETTVDKTEKTIERAEEFKENIIVEDIKRKEKKDIETNDEDTATQKDRLMEEAKSVVDKHNIGDNDDNNTKKKQKSNGRKRFWITMFWIVVALLLLCVLFVFAHWMGFLKNIKQLDPITNKLSYYIPVREKKEEVKQPKTVIIDTTVVETPTEQVEEESAAEEVVEQPVTPAPNTNKTAKKQTAKKEAKKETKQNTQPTPAKQEEEVVDNTPVVVQNHSKLGFDVVCGVYSNQEAAKKQAQKAKRLGYDGYVINKIKAGSPIFYTSYGSRRTQKEAADLCTLIKNRLGGDFYIISR